MAKLFLGLFFVSAMLFANEKECLDDFNTMSNAYYTGVKLEYKKEHKSAIKEFQDSIKFSYVALESCSYFEEFDITNAIYEYMTSSEIKVNSLQEKMYTNSSL